MLKKATVSLDSAILFISSKKFICCRTMSLFFHFFTIMQFAESSAIGQLTHSGHVRWIQCAINLYQILNYFTKVFTLSVFIF